MPLVKREIMPVFLSRQHGSSDGFSDLESVTNATLSSIILQLSNLSKHAEDIFGELYCEADSICRRSNVLQERVDRLSETVTKLDATKDDVSLQDIQLRKAFKSSFLLDQEVVAARTMPSAMRDTYMRCDKPPKLNILSQYRDDDKEALKFYTDPKYFFELWRKEIEDNIRDIKVRKKEKKRQKIPKQPRSGKVRGPVKKTHDHMAGGKELAPKMPIMCGIAHDAKPEPGPHTDTSQSIANNTATHNSINDIISNDRPISRPPAPPEEVGQLPNGIVPKRMAPAPPPAQFDYHQQDISHMNNGYQTSQNDPNYPLPSPPSSPTQNSYPFPPAPSPPPTMNTMQQAYVPPPPPPPPEPGMNNLMNNSVPPPPPPPPPPVTGAQNPIQIVPPPPPMDIVQPQVVPSPPAPVIQPPKPVYDPRSALLTAIKTYKNDNKLRKVEVQNQNRLQPQDNSVEAILSRRIALEQSDSEESSSFDSGDDEEWID